MKACNRLGSTACWRGAPGRGNIPTGNVRYFRCASYQYAFQLTRELCLFRRYMFITRRFDIPLRQSTFPLKDRNNVRQIWSGFPLFWWWTRTSLPLPTPAECIAISTSTSSGPVIWHVSVASSRSVIFVPPMITPSVTSVSIPFSLISSA